MGPSDVSASSSTELKVSLGRPGDTRGRNIVEAADEGGARGWRAVTTVDDGRRRATEGRPVTRRARAGAAHTGSQPSTRPRRPRPPSLRPPDSWLLRTGPAVCVQDRLLVAWHGVGNI